MALSPAPDPKSWLYKVVSRVAQGGVIGVSNITNGVGWPSPRSSVLSFWLRSGFEPLVEESLNDTALNPFAVTMALLL